MAEKVFLVHKLTATAAISSKTCNLLLSTEECLKVTARAYMYVHCIKQIWECDVVLLKMYFSNATGCLASYFYYQGFHYLFSEQAL